MDSNAGEGVLIDLSDEEKIPFPQQLMFTAEVDDTFGLFLSKQRSSSAPISNLSSGVNGGDVFSPKILPNNDSMDSVFENPKGTPMKPGFFMKHRMERKDSVLSGISNLSSIRDCSTASSFGLNEGFVDSTRSNVSEGNNSFQSARTTMNTTAETEDRSPDKENSPPGIMEAFQDKDDSQLLDLSGFTLSDGEGKEASPAKEKEVKEEKQEKEVKKAMEPEESDIFARVLKRQSLKKQGNEAIARKVQEMFDAASPSKNPQLFVGMPKFRTYTPARKPIITEPFSYGTPKRQMPFTSSPSAGGTKNVSFSDSPLESILNSMKPLETVETAAVEAEKRQDRIIAHVIPTPVRNSSKLKDSVEQLDIVKASEQNRNSTPVRMRLSFSSTSSESVSEPPSFVKEVKTAVIHPRIHPQIRLQTKPKTSVLGGRRSGDVKDLQPMKAVHSLVPPKPSSISAPVYRKFPVPVATSSPIVSSTKVRQIGTPPRHTKSSLARQNAGHRASMSPSSSGLNTSHSRIPQSPSPFKHPQENNIRPIPKRKPLVLPQNDQPQAGPSNISKRRSSQGSTETGNSKVGKVPTGLQRTQGVPKDTHLKMRTLSAPKF